MHTLPYCNTGIRENFNPTIAIHEQIIIVLGALGFLLQTSKVTLVRKCLCLLVATYINCEIHDLF